MFMSSVLIRIRVSQQMLRPDLASNFVNLVLYNYKGIYIVRSVGCHMIAEYP